MFLSGALGFGVRIFSLGFRVQDLELSVATMFI